MIIDCNHANSGKDPYKQPAILEEITRQKNLGNKSVVGFMVEGNIYGGSQAVLEMFNNLK